MMNLAQANIHETKNGWYVETGQGSEGPLDSRQEAAAFLELLNKANAARTETVNQTD